ncbi:MAG: XRE family transcriptional regulator [Oscillospiraceae bacterium]|nr:XRE family transcriptional regulator [Oscillospiraceae bacterium]
MEELRQVAARIRELRDICGFSASEVAEKLEIPEADYIRYEADGNDIPINVLFRLAAVLGVDLNELLTGRAPHLESYCLVKRGKGLNIDRYPGYMYQSLAYTYKHRVMEPLLVTVEPDEQEAAPVSHGGQEFNICLEGTMELLFDGKTIRLEEGDSVYFNPSRPHGQRAVGGRARFLTVITL